jgi:response regulator RpfG family c-di-GMP phosphodiesterase
LFTVADVWDALLSDRPYRPAWQIDQARAYILEQAGKHFDPQVVEVFFQVQFKGKRPTPVSILAVDDDINMTYLLGQALQDRYRVYTANSSDMALEILEENEVALVITDMKMPGLSGVELLEQAQGIRPGVLGIIVSGYTDPDALAAALNLGCVRGFLSKPWNFDQLLDRVEQVLISP